MEQKCKNCGRVYEAKTARSLFCSDRCRAAYHMRKKREKEKKWYNAKTPFWVPYLLFVLLAIGVFYFVVHTNEISRLEKKLEQYQDSIRTLPKEYQAKFPGVGKE